MIETFFSWNTFTADKAAREIERELKNAESVVLRIEAEPPTTYEAYVDRLTEGTRPLNEVWGRVSHMLGVMNDASWRAVEEKYQPQMVEFSLRVGQSKKLYEIAKTLVKKETNPLRRRILEKTVEGAELSGVGLEGAARARFNEIQMKLAKLSMDFANAVIDATKAFSYEKDGKTYTIDDGNFPETMKHCADREVREKLYRARVTRAPENEARVTEILRLRDEEAKLLGFPNYAALSISTKSAPSVAAVRKMIDDLDHATRAVWAREEAELPRLEGVSELAPWDRAFAAERLREAKYAYREEDLKRHLALPVVLKGLFQMTRKLFGVEVRELTGAERPPVWHPDVRFFEVREGDAVIAYFYFDPYVRLGLKQGGAWMNEILGRRKLADGTFVKPIATIVTNFPRPEDGEAMLPFREVETLFHEFGHALQHMLTRVDEEGAAGINLIEWDAVEVASQFMENWCLDDRTGIPIPAELKKKVRAAKNFQAASMCRRQLAFAKLDLLLHSNSEGDANQIKNEQFDHFNLVRIPEDRFLSGFLHIFAGSYAAGYYGYKWAEVMSADCYGAFEEAQLTDDALREVGRRYRETILAAGGSKSALEVFRDFRGRDPEISAILRQQDLVK